MIRALVIIGTLFALLSAATFGIRSCMQDYKDEQREAGKTEVATNVLEVSHNATVRQAIRNETAATQWHDREKAISLGFEPFHTAVKGMESLPVVSGGQPESLGLDSLVPADVERGLRLRIVQTNDEICVGAAEEQTSTCAAWKKARTDALVVTGKVTWRYLLVYIGKCLEVIALSNNDKAAVEQSVDTGKESTR